MSLLDTMFDLGECFDWLTPMSAFVLDLVNGPAFHFVIDADDGGLAHDVIKAERVDCWGCMFIAFRGVYMASCRLGDAGRLWAAFEAAGVGLLNTDRPPMMRPVVKAPAVRRPAAVRGRSRLWDLLDK